MKKRVLACMLACSFVFSQTTEMVYAAEITTELAEEIELNEEVAEETAEDENNENEENVIEVVEEEIISESEVSEDEIETLSFEDANEMDTTDTDGDGLIDYWEESIGTDINNADTDGDGLTDYVEFSLTGTDPLKACSNDDGVSDFDADADNDGLSNGQEIKLGLDPSVVDTDLDGLSDGEEVNIYNTDPSLSDTDADGASDYFEVMHSDICNPLVAEESITISFTSEDGLFAAKLTGTPAVISGVSIEKNETSISADETDVEATAAIYTDSYRIKTANEDDELTGYISFMRNEGSFSKASNTSVYVYVADEEGVVSTSKINTDIVNGMATAFIKYAGEYVVLDSEAVYAQAQAAKKNASKNVVVSEETAANTNDFNHDGISDEDTKALCDGTLLLADCSKVFGEMTYEEVQHCDDLDGDGLKNGKELSITIDENGVKHVTLLSSPVNEDTDADGIRDFDDTDPLNYGMAGGIVGSIRMVTRYRDGAHFTSGHAYIVFTSYVDNLPVSVAEIYNYYLLNPEYAEAVKENSDFLLWRYTANQYDYSVSEPSAEQADYCLDVANSVYQIQNTEKNQSAAFTMNRGDFFSIGNYNLMPQMQAVLGAFAKGDFGDQLEYALILDLYRKFTGDDTITLGYVLAHFTEVIAELSFDSYIEGEDVINGTTEGGIYINRELYKQKWCQDQFANRMYETEVTQKELNEMMEYYGANNYYCVITHNCARVASDAWNIAVGYERNAADTLEQDANGNYRKTALYIQSRAEGFTSVMDTPAQISSVLESWRVDGANTYTLACGNTVVRHNKWIGQDVEVVRGAILTDTFGTKKFYELGAEDIVPDEDDTTAVSRPTSDVSALTQKENTNTTGFNLSAFLSKAKSIAIIAAVRRVFTWIFSWF